MTADSDPPLASEAPSGRRRRAARSALARALAAVLLVVGCVSSIGSTSMVESSYQHTTAVPSPVDELPAPTSGVSSVRQRIATARRKYGRGIRRAARADDTRRSAHWLPVQFRLMAPTWRGPTVLRL